MNIVFMGTPDFAVNSLKSIIKEGYNVCAVFTQPDKPKGRGYKLAFSPVKECALENNINVFQPTTLKDDEAFNILKELNPDIIIVVAYGKILPENIINLPKCGCINVHASLLPKYRGAAPIQWSVINGEEKTGVTTMYMDIGLDTGDMLLTSETKIEKNETSGELHDRLSLMGADLIIKTIKEIENGNIKRTKQKDEESTYASMLNKSLGLINWEKPAIEIHNLVRGLNPWPIAYTSINGKVLKIYKTLLNDQSGNPGEIISENPFVVGCGDNKSIEILEVQYEGKKRMHAQDFLRGHKIDKKIRLG